MRIYFSLLLATLIIVTSAAILIAAGMGYMEIGAGDILAIVRHHLLGTTLPAGLDPSSVYIIWEVRLPRILMASLVGAGLAVSGTVYQGILLNPLADPYTLGISSGAAFGASLALLFNITGSGILGAAGCLSTPIFAFAGAAATLILVMRLASFGGQISAETLILAGVIVGAILSAGISFMKYIAGDQVAVIIFWLMGSFASATWQGTGVMLITLLFCLGITSFYARDLNIMSLGRRSSDALGVETVKVRKILLLTASLLAAVCVSLSGIIGFIGLIVPHLTRYLTGPDNRRLLPVACLIGALLLLFADTLTRAVLPLEVPIGVLTALIGGPFFCLIFRKKQQGRNYD
ncbi:MAG: iron ABC transporter permease [Desulforhopalus sp.]|nr:iron ABC transporter permease [Desulforhopalus sp.]